MDRRKVFEILVNNKFLKKMFNSSIQSHRMTPINAATVITGPKDDEIIIK
jgi:hypothetical protein